MTKSNAFHNATLAALFLATLAPIPASAQRSVEYGYKDRIFEQKYLLPDSISAFQARNYLQMSGIRALATGSGDLLDPRGVEAAGGTCTLIFITKQPAPELTPAQATIDKMPKTRAPESGDALMRQPASESQKCMVQMQLFQEAFSDSLSMDHQLAALAQAMQSRFAEEWLSPSEIADPQMQRGAARFRSIAIRRSRLVDRGIVLPAALEDADSDEDKAPSSIVRYGLLKFCDDAVFRKYDAALTAVEESAVRAVEEARGREEAARKEEERHRWERERQAATAYAQEARNLEIERSRREKEEQDKRERDGRDRQPPPDTAERQPQVVAALPAADPRQGEAQEQRRREEAERQETARRAEISRLAGRLADLDRTISRLQARLVGQQGAMLRAPFSPQNAFSGIAGMSQVQAELDQAQAERFEVARTLDRLRKAATTSASRSQPAGKDGGDCRQGAMCRVVEVTLFCRTPQQMAAILSQRPGPARKQTLGVFTASGDCRQIGEGQTLSWTAPITTVQPKGEPLAELVPGTLADGTSGFLLKDGIIARTGGAAR